MAARAASRAHLHVPLPSDESDQEDHSGGEVRERPDRVKLAPLWPRKVIAWFTLAESSFNRNGVVSSRLKFDLVLPALSDETLDQIDGILQAANTLQDPYRALKTRLLEIFEPAKLDLMEKIIWGPELGGQKPSQLMDSMLSLLPPGETDGLLFRAHFLNRLPADIKAQVAIQFEQLGSRDLAKLADSMWIARNSKKGTRNTVAAVSSAADDQLEEDEMPVAAIKPKKKQFGSSNKQKRSGPPKRPSGRGERTGGQVFLCARHKRFGSEAWKCDEPDSCFLASSSPSEN